MDATATLTKSEVADLIHAITGAATVTVGIDDDGLKIKRDGRWGPPIRRAPIVHPDDTPDPADYADLVLT